MSIDIVGIWIAECTGFLPFDIFEEMELIQTSSQLTEMLSMPLQI